jgi:REP element-mobilizing transposase RayT
MALWRLYYHLVWATKEREPLISGAREPILYGYIVRKADALSCIVHAINGTPDHIHIVASVPPILAISSFVKVIKGSSAHYLNQASSSANNFGWQAGYGVFSLGQKQLERAIAYVHNQKIHHAEGTTIRALEEDG